MKRSFTVLMAAFALMICMMMPLGMKGQTSVTLFSETFNSCAGTGGNDGSWSGSIATSDIHTDNTGWSFTKESGAYKCAKFGTGSIKGVATTPSITFTGNATLTFKAGAWNSSSEKTTLNLSASGGTLKQNGNTISSVTMTKGSWTTYTIDITGVTSSVQITFEGYQASNSRFFLDEIVVSQAASVAAPTFSPAAGTYTSTQNVTISSTTSGATIYYTTDGSTPTTSSSVYSSPISVSSTTTIKAFAVKSGMTNSTVATATYTINNGTQYTITFNPGSGTCSTTTMSGGAGSSITLPTASPSSACADAGWTFVGWATSSVNETNTAPTLLTGSYTIHGNATLYAVYRCNSGSATTSDPMNFSSGEYNSTYGTITWTMSGVMSIKQERNGNSNSAPSSDYVSTPRWYKGNKITITPSTRINSITITATSESYATALANSTYSNASATSSGTSVTITPNNGNNTVTITMGGQCRLSSLSVNYSYSVYSYATSPNCMACTITLEAGNGTCNTSTMSGVSGNSLTLPSATPSAECAAMGWTFAGWAESNVNETTTAPTLYTGSYTPTNSTTLYAVYKLSEGNNGSFEYVFADQGYENAQVVYSDVMDATSGIGWAATDGTTAPTYYDTGEGLRVYNGGTFSVTTNNNTIVAVTLTFSPGSYTFNSGETNPITWSGSQSTDITWNVTRTCRLQKVNVTYDSRVTTYATTPDCREQVATPTFSPAAGEYSQVQNVSISCGTTGATIYYTTDGSTPTTGSSVYGSAITVSETTTIKAMAVKTDLINSAVATATYTIVSSISLDESSFSFPYTGGNDSFDYTITNPVSGAVVNVTSSSWITATVSGNTVNFQVAQNDNVARSGDITLTYAKNGTTLATATVTVDQESNPVLPGGADSPYTVAQALEIIAGYADNQTSSGEVYVTGIVSQIDQIEVVQYNNATYYISDDGTSTTQLEVFRGKYLHNTDFLSEDELLLGDVVVVKGYLKKYRKNNTSSVIPEIDANNYIVSLNRAVQPVTFNPVSCVTPSLTVWFFTESLYEGYDVQIYYTTDGSDPITNGIAFEEAWSAFLELTQTTTIKAAAYVPELGEWSGVTEATYTIVSESDPGWQNNPYTVSQALAALDQNSNIKGAYVHGIVSRITQIEITQYHNATYFISDDGQTANELQVYRGKYIARGDFMSTDQLQIGDEVTVFGDLTIYGSTNPVKEFKPQNYIEDWYRPTSIMINPGQFTFSCNETSGLIDVLYSDDILVNVNNPTVQLCNASGAPASYDWIDVTLSQANAWDLEYVIDANAGDEPRTAYLKVLCTGQNIESNLVTITQNEYQIDFATLDFYFNGVRDDIENTVGLTGFNLGTDYAASSSPTTRLKFNNGKAQDGSILQSSLVLKIDEVPGILSYDIKGNDFAGSTFCLVVSNNGVRYDTIATYKSTTGPGITTLPVNGLLHDTIYDLPATTRYIKWVYVTKNDGNVGVGNIRLNKPVAQYDIVVNNPMVGEEQIGTIYVDVLTTPMTAAEGTNVGLSINYSSSYYFVEWVVTDDADNLVPVEDNHFIMPASNVTVTATLVEANSPCTYAFSANGEVGSLLSSTVGSVIQMPSGSNITFNGQTFTFRGWTANPNDVTHLLRPGASYTLSQNTTFHAVYYQTVVGLTAEKHYAKVTSNLSDWSGEYLIVYEDGGVAFNGGLDPLDAVSNTIPVTISNGVILASETLDAAEFTIAAVEGGYTIRSASGKYIGKLADSNGMNENASIQYVNSISYYDFGGSYGGEVDIIGSGGAYMRFNTTSNQNRFRYYSTSTFTNYKGIQLYRYVGSVSNLYTRIFMNVTADNITIEGPSLVPNGSVLEVTSITNNLGADRLLVDEGGQLVTSNNANASVRKFITPYQQQQGKDNYYLIASPVNNLNPVTAGMTGSNFDLYAFDQSAQGEEWQNYKANNFNLAVGQGYLYANNYGGFINMGGTMAANASAVTITDVSGKPFAGWNLIGNPYPCNVTIDKPFYRLAEGGAALATVATDESVAIAPMEGVFVCADGTETVGFTKASDVSTTSGRNLLSMKVSRNRSSKDERVDTDNAIVRFGEGAMLRKLVLNPDLSQLYVAQDGTDYAIVNAEAEGEMPLSFRPSENGSYTISVAAEGVEMNYLHLIDHKTGADVDLLQTPYYTFEAKTGDYESRFMLVFSVGASSDDEPFAYYNGSQWVVSSDGEATLQIVDMMGRVLSSQNVNGDAEVSINRAAGVYLLRMLQGDDIKVQKIIIH